MRGEVEVDALIKKFAEFRDTFVKDTESAEVFGGSKKEENGKMAEELENNAKFD